MIGIMIYFECNMIFRSGCLYIMKKYDVVIVGCGPSGIFTALELLKNDINTKILMLDEGKSIKVRKCPKAKTKKCVNCLPCNISSGFGGAGAFSDGKLSLSKDVGGWLEDYIGEEKLNELIGYVDDIYLNYGGNPEVSYNALFANQVEYDCSKYGLKFVKCPVRHLGTEKSQEIMEKLYDYICSCPNTEVVCLANVLNVSKNNNNYLIEYKCNGDVISVNSSNIVLAVGRSGAGWLSDLCKKLEIETTNKQVDIGVRVELPRSICDHLTDKLYEFKIYNTSKTTENVVRTFCMNPGGFVSQENYDAGLAVVNGHSYHDLKSNLTNFALLVSCEFTSPFNEPVSYGKYIARLANMLTGGPVMVQRLKDLRDGRRSNNERISKLSYKPTLVDAVPGDLSFVLPSRIINALLETFDALENICPGISGDQTILYGVEVKFYSSNVVVDNNLMTKYSGMYAIGDGAGITRGLIQASVSGVVCARDIINRMKK